MASRDPHHVLGVDPSAGPAAIKAAWRRLAREHHPDLAGDDETRDASTRRMAEINAAYEELRPDGRPGRPGRKGRDKHWSGGAWAGRHGPAAGWENGDESGPGGREDGRGGSATGPPPDEEPPPVTARFDASHLFRARNQTVTPDGGGYRHHPRPRAEPLRARAADREARRASDPNGPLERRPPRHPPRREVPSLAVARSTEIPFGKFSGWSLGAIAVVEPTYLEWVARTVTRDPDLVDAVRVVLAGLERHPRRR